MLEKYVSVGGYKIRYLEEGSSQESIVLLHGLGGMAERWLPAIPFLSKSHRVLAPDLIGHGLSDKPQTDYTPDFFKRITLEFIESLPMKTVYVVGNSLGGEIAAECAAACHQLIKKAVLVSPAGIMKKSTPALDAYTMAALYPNHESVRMAYKMMLGGDRDVSDKSVENFISNMTRPNTKMVFLSTLLGIKNSPAITEKLKKINIPVLLIWGREDKIIPVNYSKDFVSAIQNCKFIEMEGCGHIPYEEKPEEFSKLVLDFLSENP